MIPRRHRKKEKSHKEDPTEELGRLVRKDRPNPQEVEKWVGKGADLSYSPDPASTPNILNLFILRNLDTCVAACLQSPKALDFATGTCYHGLTSFHLVCLAKSPECAVAVLEPLVARVQKKKPGDKVDWEKKDDKGTDLLSFAARRRMLHYIWPVLKRLMFFYTRITNPFVLTQRVYEDDWVALGKDQRYFRRRKGFADPSKPITDYLEDSDNDEDMEFEEDEEDVDEREKNRHLCHIICLDTDPEVRWMAEGEFEQEEESMGETRTEAEEMGSQPQSDHIEITSEDIKMECSQESRRNE